MLTLTQRTADLVAASLLGCVGLFVIADSRRMPYGGATEPGPGFFPTILGVLLFLVSVGLVLRALRKRSDASTLTVGHRYGLLVLGAVTILGLALEGLGSVTAIALFVFLCLTALSPLRWYIAALAAVTASLLAYAFFARFLGIPLPVGSWWYS